MILGIAGELKGMDLQQFHLLVVSEHGIIHSKDFIMLTSQLGIYEVVLGQSFKDSFWEVPQN